MNGPAIDPRLLRVSDAERAHVLGLLERATGQGLIDLGEFNERSALVIAARTRGELNAVLLDLPGLSLSGRSVADASWEVGRTPQGGPGFSGAVRPAGGAPTDVLELTGWGSRTFRGTWTVPPMIVIGGTGASTRLDFTEARVTSQTVTVEFRTNYAGAAEFVVPRGTVVRLDALAMRGGHLTNKIPPSSEDPVRGMTLVLTGVKKAGLLTIRHPRQGLLSGWR